MHEPTRTSGEDSAIHSVSAWILRIGVVGSVLVMLLGIAFSFMHGTTSVDRMQSEPFDPNLVNMAHGIAQGHGKSIIELGIYLLVLTPIFRVAASMIIFVAVEKDKTYGIVCLGVLILTLAGLLWVGG